MGKYIIFLLMLHQKGVLNLHIENRENITLAIFFFPQ